MHLFFGDWAGVRGAGEKYGTRCPQQIEVLESVHFATASRPLQMLFDCRKFVTMSADIKFVHNTYRSTVSRSFSPIAKACLI